MSAYDLIERYPLPQQLLAEGQAAGAVAAVEERVRHPVPSHEPEAWSPGSGSRARRWWARNRLETPAPANWRDIRQGPDGAVYLLKDGMEQPLYYWDPIIGPSGMVFYTANLFPAWKGSLFIGGHGSRDLVRLTLTGERVSGEERLLVDLKEAIRDVRQGPDRAIYLLADGGEGRLIKRVP